MPKVTNGEHTANIPAADLEWFLENGWKEVKAKAAKAESETEEEVDETEESETEETVDVIENAAPSATPKPRAKRKNKK